MNERYFANFIFSILYVCMHASACVSVCMHVCMGTFCANLSEFPYPEYLPSSSYSVEIQIAFPSKKFVMLYLFLDLPFLLKRLQM